MKKRVPTFKNEDEERDFWSKNDSSDYVNWKKAERGPFPNLKASVEGVTLSNVDEFDMLIQETRKQAKRAGLKRKDIRSAIAKVRRRGSK